MPKKRYRPEDIRAIKWNFTKFLVDASGVVVKRFAPATEPADLEGDIGECFS